MAAMVSSEPAPAEVSALATADAAAVGEPDAAACSVRVYEAPEQDWRLWRELRLAALEDAPYAFGDTLAAAQARSEEDWRSWWREPDPGGPRFIALVDGEPAAMCSICFPDFHDNEPLLISMWSSPKARGRGAARAMLDACIDYCVRVGRPRLLLGVVDDNLPARRLYESYGFIYSGGSEPLFSDPSKLVLWMHKPLP